MSDPTSISSLITQTITANARSYANAKVQIVTLPKNLQALEHAQTLRGQIVQIDQNGSVTIRTDQGQVIIRTDHAARLQNGAPIEVWIESGSPPTQVALRPAPQNATTTQNQQSLRKINLPQTLTLTDITSGAALNITPYNTAHNLSQPFIDQIQNQLSPLAPLSVTLNGLGTIATNKPNLEIFTLPISTPLITPTGVADLELKPLGTQTNIPFRAIAAGIISAPLQEPISSTDTPRISTLSKIQIEKISAPTPSIFPDTPKDFALINARIGETSAVLEGFTQNRNFAVLRFTAPYGLANQHYALQVPIEDIPVGSKISLNILQTAQSSAQTLSALTTSYYLTPELWPVFQDIQQTLAQTNQQAAQVFNTLLPNAAAPSKLDASTLFFVAAMRSGDIQGWLGDKAVDAMKRAGKADLMGRLGRELSGLARMNTDNISGDWRGLSLPLAWQNDIHKVVLYYRSEDDEHDSDQHESGNKTHFVMDLNLSHIGKVQLDGLFTGQSKSVGRLDLVLRTEQSFTQSMKQEMRQAYKSALEKTQITGELSFQGHLDQWVRITPDEVKEYEAEV